MTTASRPRRHQPSHPRWPPVTPSPAARAPDLLETLAQLRLLLVVLVEARAGDLVGRHLLRAEVAGVAVWAVVAGRLRAHLRRWRGGSVAAHVIDRRPDRPRRRL